MWELFLLFYNCRGIFFTIFRLKICLMKNIHKISSADLEAFRNAEIDTWYVIIGFLNEYHGGYLLDDQMVDRFYRSESEQAQIFKKLCEFYLASTQCENDVELDIGPVSYVDSKTICKKLRDYFCADHDNYLGSMSQRLSEDKDDLYKTAEELYGDSNLKFNFKKYSFLLGVIIRNRLSNSEIKIVNASHKVELTINILEEFGVFGDNSFKVDHSLSTIPGSTTITLSEDNFIWSEIDKYVEQIKNY